jgi:type I restriction enzyme M protein
LFTGDAGQGESNVRQWIFDNDWLEAIIALPMNIFYNTGIATFIWVLTNRKPPHREGKVQLIDATAIFQPLRKNLGKKNCEFSDEQISQVTNLFLAFEETEQSKIFPNKEFGYWKITVERPLRLATHVTPERVAMFKSTADERLHEPAELLAKIAGGKNPHLDFNDVKRKFETAIENLDIKLRATEFKNIFSAFAIKDPLAEPVVKKKTKKGIEYEPDPDLRDTEQIPLLEDGGIKAFFEREVLPHASDAWIDDSKTLVGYEISFTRHFYKPPPIRTLEQIRTELETLQAESEGLLDQIVATGVSS